MSTARRGFASMDKGKQREIASKGGKAAHAQGSAHEWNTAEAKEAGRKGGERSRKRKAGIDPDATEAPQAGASVEAAPPD